MVATPQDLGEDEMVVDGEDERIRLLICYVCNTIEPLPWFDGPVEHDDTLHARLAGHRTAEGHPHRGNMLTVSEKSWDDPNRKDVIVKQLSEQRGSGDVGLGNKLYDLRSTFSEDAMTCWRVKHNRTENCEKYRADEMRLLADTREERKELGLSTRQKDRPAGTYLCNFCPVHSIVMTRARKAQGYY